MLCPVCGINLRKTIKGEVAYYLCDECRGIWVAGKELEILANTLADKNQSGNMVPTVLKARQANPVSSRQDVHLCPECRGVMNEFNFAYDSNIMIDKCSSCSGIWLDANEIKEIARHIQANPQAESLGLAVCDFHHKLDKLKTAPDNRAADIDSIGIIRCARIITTFIREYLF